MSSESHVEPIDTLLPQAQEAAAQNRIADAEKLYSRILTIAPDHIESLSFLGLHALGMDQPERAVDLLERACRQDAADPQLLKALGLAYVLCERLDQARIVLERAVRLAPTFVVARLHLAQVLERLGDERAALTQYFGAVSYAQRHGRWLDDNSTAPGLRDRVKHAMAVIDEGRRKHFGGVLAGHDADALQRIRAALDGFLGEASTTRPDARQNPQLLYVPGLPTQAHFARALFPWQDAIEADFDAIRSELLAALNGGAAEDLVLLRDGRHEARAAARCPHTAALLETLPLPRIRDYAPDVCVSVFPPGKPLLPHGATNAVLVTHLPLRAPADAALGAGGESRAWEAGRCTTFDATFSARLRQPGPDPAVALVMTCWNPHLESTERDALADLIAAIGDFHRLSRITEA